MTTRMFMVVPRLSLVLAAMLLVVGCKDKKGSAADGTADGTADGASTGSLKACDDYFTLVTVCIDNSIGKAKQSFELGRVQFEQLVEEAVDDAARKNAARSCQAAHAALQRSPACLGGSK